MASDLEIECFPSFPLPFSTSPQIFDGQEVSPEHQVMHESNCKLLICPTTQPDTL